MEECIDISDSGRPAYFHNITTTIAIFQSVKKTARIQFWFSALLFPKEILKVVRCTDIAVRFRICKHKVLKYIQSEVTGFKNQRFRPSHGCGTV